jgi:hypothetical protein
MSLMRYTECLWYDAFRPPKRVGAMKQKVWKYIGNDVRPEPTTRVYREHENREEVQRDPAIQPAGIAMTCKIL